MKRSKIIIQQIKALENLKIVDIKSVYIEHPKTSSKFSKAITRVENFSEVSGAAKKSNSPLYIKAKKVNHFWMNKM